MCARSDGIECVNKNKKITYVLSIEKEVRGEMQFVFFACFPRVSFTVVSVTNSGDQTGDFLTVSSGWLDKKKSAEVS